MGKLVAIGEALQVEVYWDSFFAVRRENSFSF